MLISDILLADKSDSQPNKAGCVIDACLQCSANDVLIDVGGFYYRKYGMLLPNPTHGHTGSPGRAWLTSSTAYSTVSESADCLNMP